MIGSSNQAPRHPLAPTPILAPLVREKHPRIRERRKFNVHADEIFIELANTRLATVMLMVIQRRCLRPDLLMLFSPSCLLLLSPSPSRSWSRVCWCELDAVEVFANHPLQKIAFLPCEFMAFGANH